MRWENVYIAGIGAYLPGARKVGTAELGDDVPAWVSELGYESVQVATTMSPPEMAVAAAGTALRVSGIAPEDFTLLLHGSTWYQGLEIWPTASYVADRALARGVPALDVQQRCNIGVSALELAATHLHAVPTGAVMVTTADRFTGPGVDRFTLRPGTAYGDGASAVALSGRTGFARVLCTRTVVDNSLEPLTRGGEEFTDSPEAARRPVELAQRAREHTGDFDDTESTARLLRVIRRAVVGALEESRCGMGDIARVVTPAVRFLDSPVQVHQLLGIPESRTTWDFCRTTGHLGAGDWGVGLAHLLDTGAVRAGDKVMLYGGGAGYSCTVVVIEVIAAP